MRTFFGSYFSNSLESEQTWLYWCTPDAGNIASGTVMGFKYCAWKEIHNYSHYSTLHTLLKIPNLIQNFSPIHSLCVIHSIYKWRITKTIKEPNFYKYAFLYICKLLRSHLPKNAYYWSTSSFFKFLQSNDSFSRYM